MSNDEVKLPELPEPPQPNTYQFAYSDIPYEAISAYEQGFDEATDIMHGQLHAYARIAVLADRAERDALRVDAERYRYLRNRTSKEVFDASGPEAGAWIDCEDDSGRLILITGEDADQVVDAALKAAEGGR